MTQARRPATSTQPEVGKVTIYSGPVKPYASARKSSQPPITGYKIYSSKKVPTVRVRLRDSDDAGEFVINQSDFNPDLHEEVK